MEQSAAVDVSEKLAEVGRALVREGLTHGAAGNLSARLPGGDIVISAAGVSVGDLDASKLVVMDVSGRRLRGGAEPSSEQALHLACLHRYPELGAVIHTHAVHASMFALARRAIPCVLEEFELYVGGEVPVAEYRVTGSEALAEAVAPLLAERSAVLLAGHGLLCVGRDLAEAHFVTGLVERSAQVVLGALQLGPLPPLPPEARERFAARYRQRRHAAG